MIHLSKALTQQAKLDSLHQAIDEYVQRDPGLNVCSGVDRHMFDSSQRITDGQAGPSTNSAALREDLKMTLIYGGCVVGLSGLAVWNYMAGNAPIALLVGLTAAHAFGRALGYLSDVFQDLKKI